MQTSRSFQPGKPYSRESVRDDAAPPIWSLVYHSRAARPMSESDLDELQRAAAARNHAEGLTGLMIYDEGRFFQWLEGPEASIEKVWPSIQRDPRHGAIDVLGRNPAPLRCFGDWDMKLSTRSLRTGKAQSGALQLPPMLIDSLSRRPHAATELLASMAIKSPVVIAREPLSAKAAAKRIAEKPQYAALRNVVEKVLIPQLAALHTGDKVQVPVDPRIAELAKLLIATDPHAGDQQFGELQSLSRSIGALCTDLYEPLARSLGDLWQADDCTELELTVALCRVQSSMRNATSGAARTRGVHLPAVLVTPQPGEQHRLGASLDAEVLWQAGWNTQYEAPATDEALEQLVADTWFDALDLSLSNSFRREHWLPRMAQTIQHVRDASRNPQLVVVVGGRVFYEHEQIGADIGADASNRSAPLLAAKIMATLKR
ncbi:BLUF domain-containing protein [Nevskia ramosa]|uniref:BLUF domain-containing protein n=1 Tax=Nevskia ramosa TaxID=64002 RepID=UPI0003B4152A|nr:BLUF domain-containing protein [Nevskia ramosa]